LLFISLLKDKQRHLKTSSNSVFRKQKKEQGKRGSTERMKEQLCYLAEISSQLKIYFTLTVQF
jgi:hypothetical protein